MSRAVQLSGERLEVSQRFLGQAKSSCVHEGCPGWVETRWCWWEVWVLCFQPAARWCWRADHSLWTQCRWGWPVEGQDKEEEEEDEEGEEEVVDG